MASRLLGRLSIPSRQFASTVFRRDVSKLTAASSDETSHFNALASSWWDVNGPQRILHKMNLLRMDYINKIVKSHVKHNQNAYLPDDHVYIPPYSLDLLPKDIRARIVQQQNERRNELLANSRLKVLDVGCGGGILTESLARLKYISSVRGIDLSEDVLDAAKAHQRLDPLLAGKLSYDLVPIQDLPKHEKYDLITVFEMLEHVHYPAQVLAEVFDRMAVGGWVILSTINRDPISWFTTIFMGEHFLRIVPVGTHTLGKYIDQTEIRDWVLNSAYKDRFKVVDSRGCVYVPAYGWKLTDFADIGNYFMPIQRTH